VRVWILADHKLKAPNYSSQSRIKQVPGLRHEGSAHLDSV